MADWTKDEVRDARTRLQTALDVIQAELGVTIKVGNARFMGALTTFKLEVCKVGTNGETTNKYEEAFKKGCRLYGFLPSDLGRTVVGIEGTYTLAGMNPKGKAYKFVARAENGKLFKFTADQVRRGLR